MCLCVCVVLSFIGEGGGGLYCWVFSVGGGSSSLFAQTVTPVAPINVAIRRESGKGPFSFSLTGVSAGHVSAPRFRGRGGGGGMSDT